MKCIKIIILLMDIKYDNKSSIYKSCSFYYIKSKGDIFKCSSRQNWKDTLDFKNYSPVTILYRLTRIFNMGTVILSVLFWFSPPVRSFAPTGGHIVKKFDCLCVCLLTSFTAQGPRTFDLRPKSLIEPLTRILAVTLKLTFI